MTAASPEVATTVRASRRPGSAGAGSSCTSSSSRSALVWLFPLAVRRSTPRSGPTPTPRRLGLRVAAGGATTSTTTSRPGTTAQLPRYFLNTADHRGPGRHPRAASSPRWLAFVLSRFSWRFNLLLLMIFTAGNLLPPAGHHHAPLPDVPAAAAAGPAERQRALVRPVLRRDRRSTSRSSWASAPSC